MVVTMVERSSWLLAVQEADITAWLVKLCTVWPTWCTGQINLHRQVVGDVGGVRNVMMGGNCMSNNWGLGDQSTVMVSGELTSSSWSGLWDGSGNCSSMASRSKAERGVVMVSSLIVVAEMGPITSLIVEGVGEDMNEQGELVDEGG